MKFLVTALVSVYRAESYIEICLRNLIQQSLFERNQLEVLILDADSPGDEKALVDPFLDSHPSRIRYVRLDRRLNLYETWNLGARLSRGQFLTSANVDDLHEPKCLQHLSNTLTEHPSLGLVYGQQNLVSEKLLAFEQSSTSCMNRKPKFFAPLVLLQNPCGSQPMWRKTLHQQLGGFDERFRVLGDYDFVIRASLVSRIQLVNAARGTFLDRKDSLSRSGMPSELEILKKRYYHPDTILKLYLAEGFGDETSEKQSALLEDFIARALLFFSVWGGSWSMRSNYNLALLAAQKLLDSSTEKGRYWIDLIKRLQVGDTDECISIRLEDFLLHGVGTNLDLFNHDDLPGIRIPQYLERSFNGNPFSLKELRWKASGFDFEVFNNWIQQQRTSRKLILWGFSERAKQCIRNLTRENVKVDGVVDRNAEELREANPDFDFISFETLCQLDTKPLIAITTGDRETVKRTLESAGFVQGKDFI